MGFPFVYFTSRKHVRWWWAVDFIRRIVFIAVYVFTPDWQMKQVCAICFCFFEKIPKPETGRIMVKLTTC